jgi:hypothetical protein
VVNEACTTVETPVPFDWATDVDKTVGTVTVTPIVLINHIYAELAVIFIPMSCAPCDFSACFAQAHKILGQVLGTAIIILTHVYMFHSIHANIL